MKVYIFLSICLACLASPLLDSEEEKKAGEPVTADLLDGYLDVLKTFKGVLPEDLTKTLESLNLYEKNEIIRFMSDWYNGRIKKPENKEEIVELIKDKLPTVYEKIDSLNTTFYEKFLKLNPETQDLLRSWRDKFISTEGENPSDSASKRLQFLSDIALSVQSMNNETKEDLRSQFPTAVNLTEGFGFSVLTTMAMIIQKIVDLFASVAGDTTAAPQECAIPAT